MKKRKRTVQELSSLTLTGLEKKVGLLRETLAMLRLESPVNKPKDTNLIAKKRKLLAKYLTVINEKKREAKS